MLANAISFCRWRDDLPGKASRGLFEINPNQQVKRSRTMRSDRAG
jgi:hypothetical protein